MQEIRNRNTEETTIPEPRQRSPAPNETVSSPPTGTIPHTRDRYTVEFHRQGTDAVSTRVELLDSPIVSEICLSLSLSSRRVLVDHIFTISSGGVLSQTQDDDTEGIGHPSCGKAKPSLSPCTPLCRDNTYRVFRRQPGVPDKTQSPHCRDT